MKITVGTTEHDLEVFSDDVKKLIEILNVWQGELSSQRLAIAKTEAAIRSLNQELESFIKRDIAAMAANDNTEEVKISE